MARTQTLESVKAARSVQGLHAMDESVDPKHELQLRIGNIGEAVVFGPQLLVATYIRPNKTRGGIHLTDTTTREDEYQGKVGLVIAMGPTAYKPSKDVDFGGVTATCGDWVVYSPHDGLAMNVKGVHCRIIDDVQVRMTLPRPDMLL